MNDWHERNRAHWDTTAGWWDTNSQALWEQGMRAPVLPFFQHAVGDLPGLAVLDAGCGTGFAAIELARAGRAVTGVDLSPAMLRLAEQRARAAGVAVRWLEGNVEELPLPDAAFDAVLAVNALEWLALPARGLAELRRVLHPGGVAVVGILGPLFPVRVGAYRRLYGEPVVMNTMMPWELIKLMEEGGWRVLGQEGVYPAGVPAAAVSDLASAPRYQSCLADLWLVSARRR